MLTQTAETTVATATVTPVQVRHLTRTFGNKLALDDVSLDVPEGSVFGLVGLNGAGKTTLLKHIMGLLRAPPGHVQVMGGDPSREPERVLRHIGYVTEEDSLPAGCELPK